MDVKFTFEDGSEVLAHYGVAGMKWGVWNPETKDRYNGSPKSNQKRLNKLDNDMRALTVVKANVRGDKERYLNKSVKARIRGNKKKADKYKALADIQSNKLKTITKLQKDTGKAMIDTLVNVEKSGQAWKVTSRDFVSPPFMRSISLSNNLKRMHGKMGLYEATDSQANASNANRFTVKDASKLSDTRSKIWKATKHNVKTYKPQKVRTDTHYIQ